MQRPSAAIKEMLENSVDAGSTVISVVAKSGGLDLIQIQDNGHGIRKEDLPILCERFTTSKLRTYEDLRSIKTFGFRGEALASISYVSHVTVTTKTSSSQCAFKAKYLDGQLVPLQSGGKADPKPCAGVNGTIITVEDLFYNLPSRRTAFRDQHEQYQYILDVVSKYSIHYGDRGISFTCKRHNQTSPDCYTPVSSSIANNIKIVYGQSVANSLICVDFSNESLRSEDRASSMEQPLSSSMLNTSSTLEDATAADTSYNNNHTIAFHVKGYVSNTNYSHKKTTLVLFINNRLVESQAIKKVVDSVYSEILPKHAHPFAYLSLDMPSENVDVNVHPTKKEVHFLFEDKILECLYLQLRQVLIGSNQSRVFQPMAVLSQNSSLFPIRQEAIVEPRTPHVPIPPAKEDTADAEVTAEMTQVKQIYAESEPDDILYRNQELSSVVDETAVNAAQVDQISQEKRRSDTDENMEPPLSSHRVNSHGSGQKSGTDGSRSSVPAHKYVRTDSSSQRLDSFFKPVAPKPPPNTVPAYKSQEEDMIDVFPAKTLTQTGLDNDINQLEAIDVESPDEEASGACPCCPAPTAGSFDLTANYCQISASKKRKPSLPTVDESLGVDPDVINKTANTQSEVQSQSQSQSDSKQGIIRAFKVVDSSCDIPLVQNKRRVMYQSQVANIQHLLRHHSPVGIVDQTSSLWQFNTKLLLVNHHALTMLLFRQLVLRQLGPTLSVLEIPHGRGINIKECILAVALDEIVKTPVEGMSSPICDIEAKIQASVVCEKACAVLLEYADMLKSYFKIGIQARDCSLYCLPDLLPGYCPDQARLPRFLFQLAARLYALKSKRVVSSVRTSLNGAALTETSTGAGIDMAAESVELTDALLEAVTDELSGYYASLPTIASVTEGGSKSDTRTTGEITNKQSLVSTLSEEGEEYLTHIIYPTIKLSLLPDSTLLEQTVFIPVGTLEKLYKVFERC